MMDVRDLASPLVRPEATNNRRDVDAPAQSLLSE